MLEITVKATTANLGPGFDSLGLALNIENKIKFSAGDKHFHDKNNLIYKAAARIFEIAGKKIPPINIEQQIGIPVCRGLGSSAACIAAGCVAGNILSKANMPMDELIKIGTEMESHPDNIVPALLGGFTVSAMDNGRVIYFRKDAYEGFKYAVMYPEYTLPTTQAREVLPKNLSIADSVFNIGRASLFTAAMITGDGELLKYACKDRLHQPYRKKLIPGFDDIIDKTQSLGALASFLSGAGPTIISIISKDEDFFESHMKDFLMGVQGNWTLKIVSSSNEGVKVKGV